MSNYYYIKENANEVWLRRKIAQYDGNQITLRCIDYYSSTWSETTDALGYVQFSRLTPNSEYIIASSEDDYSPQKTLYYRGETKEEWFQRLGIDINNNKKILAKLSDKDATRDWITNIYWQYQNEDMEDVKSNLQQILELLISDYNNTILRNNSDEDDIVRVDSSRANLEIIYDNYVPENSISISIKNSYSGNYIYNNCKFDSQTIKRKLSTGLYDIDVKNTEDGSIIYPYMYISFGYDDSNEKYNNEKTNLENKNSSLIDSNFILSSDDNFEDLEEKNILMNLASCKAYGNPILPLPKLSISTDKILSISSEENILLDSNFICLRKIHICFAEEDTLYNKNVNYRKLYLSYSYIDNTITISPYFDRNFEAEINTNFLNFNNEKYYYWIADDNEIRLSNIGVIDFSLEDEKDYNEIYAKLIWKQILKIFPKVMNTSTTEYAFLRSVIDSIDIDNLAYINMLNLLEQKITNACEDKDIFYKVILAAQNCFMLYDKNYDYDFVDYVTYRPSYHDTNWQMTIDNCIFETKSFSLKSRSAEIFHRSIEDAFLSNCYIGSDNITIFQAISPAEKRSDFIMFYYKGKENLPRLITNTIRVETINGL